MPIASIATSAKRGLIVAVACLMLGAPAFAVDSGGGNSSNSSNPSVPDLGDARTHIRNGQWKNAIAVLKEVIAGDPGNADALNLMGYSLRKSGDTDRALGFYLKALKINPNHRGAHEYLGELYVETGQMGKARDLLQALEAICGNTTCEEYEDLAEAIGI